jgi:hypothetical protein
MLKMGTEFSHRTLVNAAKGWFLSDRRSRQRGDEVGITTRMASTCSAPTT